MAVPLVVGRWSDRLGRRVAFIVGGAVVTRAAPRDRARLLDLVPRPRARRRVVYTA
jgi:hypothetical protein